MRHFKFCECHVIQTEGGMTQGRILPSFPTLDVCESELYCIYIVLFLT